MGTPRRRAGRPWHRDFLLGVLLGFVAALLRPARRDDAAPVAPPAPRPLDVPVRAPQEEPVLVSPHRAA